jgi:hypothetical protein
MKALGQGIRKITQKYHFLQLYSPIRAESINLDNDFAMSLAQCFALSALIRLHNSYTIRPNAVIK